MTQEQFPGSEGHEDKIRKIPTRVARGAHLPKKERVKDFKDIEEISGEHDITGNHDDIPDWEKPGPESDDYDYGRDREDAIPLITGEDQLREDEFSGRADEEMKQYRAKILKQAPKEYKEGEERPTEQLVQQDEPAQPSQQGGHVPGKQGLGSGKEVLSHELSKEGRKHGWRGKEHRGKHQKGGETVRDKN